MKIQKCYIENFGNLSNFSYDFDEKINIFEEKNGYGKSTLCAFIKVMFYGLQGVKARNINENERKMYLPWQGGNFGGYLDFITEQKSYRIQRYFGETAKGDSFSLIDLLTGEISGDFTENIGEELFGIDVNGFEKCTYYTALSAEKSVPSSILSKLFDDSDNVNALDNAIKRLEKREKQYQSARSGEIFDIKNKLVLLQNDEVELKERIKQADELKKSLNSLKAQKKELEAKLEVVRKDITASSKSDAQNAIVTEKIKHHSMLVQKANDSKDALDNILKKYKNGLPNEEKISEIASMVERIKQANSTEFKTKGFVLPIVLAVLSLVLLIVSFAVKSIFIYSIIAFVLMAIISTILFVVTNSSNKKANQFLAEKDSLNNEIESEFSSIFVTYDDDFDDNIKTLNKDFYEYQAEKKKYDEYSAQANEYYNAEKLGEKGESVTKSSSDELAIKEKQILKSINDISYQGISLKKDLENISSFEEKLLEIRREITVNEERLKLAQENYNAIVIAKELIINSNKNLSYKYKEKINNNFVENLNLVFDNCEAFLDDKFEVKITKLGQLREANRFSSGQRTAIELALRFSIIDAIFEKEKPFIVLDDIFNNLDDETFKTVTEKLKNSSKNIQIIYFTCSKSRVF